MFERFTQEELPDFALSAESLLTAADDAYAEISRWDGYAPTPLYSLRKLARDCGVAEVFYKDESARFGLGSFKALGGAWAVTALAARHTAAGGRLRDFVVAAATDGNHGRAVAWGGQKAGCAVKIFVHTNVSEARVAAMKSLGAEVFRADGDYDDSVRECARQAEKNGWQVVSDTSWAGYTETPKLVMAGYAALAREVWAQLAGRAPTHIILPAGVGAFAAAIAAAVWRMGARPRLCVVESAYAACLLASARRGALTAAPIRQETVMAGLSCGEPSLLAWETLRDTARDFVAIGDDEVGATLRGLAGGEYGDEAIAAGECSAAGIIALRALAAADDAGLTADSRVLLFGTEGVTDPDSYRRLVGENAQK